MKKSRADLLSAYQQSKLDIHARRVWAIIAYVVVVSIAIDAALLMSVIVKSSWSYSAAMAFSAAILAFGMLYTVLKVFRLGRSRLSR